MVEEPLRSSKVDPGAHLFPTLLVSLVRVLLKQAWPFTPPLSTPHRCSLFLSEFSSTFSPVQIHHWEQVAVRGSGREEGQMARSFWLSHLARLFQHCLYIHTGDIWPPANMFLNWSALMPGTGLLSPGLPQTSPCRPSSQASRQAQP